MREIEQETVGLSVCISALNNIVNHALVELREVKKYPGECEVYFHSNIHQQLFLLRALDFVKENGDKNLTGVKGSCVDVLKTACQSASFDKNGSINDLRRATEQLDEWLKYQSSATFWLPDLDKNVTLNVSRLELLHISGNQSKHNISRLTGVSKKFQEILRRNEYTIELSAVPFVIDYFYEHLSDNYFIYYGTWLTELLNNVRWGIREYLYPCFQETMIRKGEFRYTYRFPEGINDETSKKWYWEMMNGVLTDPYLKRFAGAHYLKDRSSLELHNE